MPVSGFVGSAGCHVGAACLSPGCVAVFHVGGCLPGDRGSGGVRRLDRLGRWLVDFPLFAQAFNAGVLTSRHVHELYKLDNPKVHHQLVESQEILVTAARDCDFSDFVNVLIYWLNASDVCRRQTRPRSAKQSHADPDGLEPSEQAAKTTCTYRKHADGSVTGRFAFDPLTGQAFRRLLDLESQELFRQDSETGVTRTPAQRQGAALINLMVRGHSGGDSTITPLIHVGGSSRRSRSTQPSPVASQTPPVNRPGICGGSLPLKEDESYEYIYGFEAGAEAVLTGGEGASGAAGVAVAGRDG